MDLGMTVILSAAKNRSNALINRAEGSTPDNNHYTAVHKCALIEQKLNLPLSQLFTGP
jgi:hypothetical protein